MADVELTELQTRIYELVTDKESISKKKIAAALDLQVRSISSPIKALLDRGVLVEDEYGEYSIAAGVREEVGNGYVQVPAPSTPELEPANPADSSPPVEDVPVEEFVEEEEEDLYGEYWKQHPEELVTFYGEEGLDALKRHSLIEALKNAIGVGQKALDSVLHFYDIDEEVRRDPPTLMRALEDAGVKHNLVGRIARETFLPEKQYSQYVPSTTEPFIERGRTPHRQKYAPRGRRARGETYDDSDDEYDDERTQRTRRPPRSREDDVPWWAQRLIQRLDVLDGGSQMGRNRQGGDQPQAVIEPVLDEYGNPIPDPNNPGGWLERKIIYEPQAQGMGGHETEYSSDLRTEIEEQNAAIDKMRETLAEHETDRKISSAVSPLLEKITGLENRGPAAKVGMSDEQFKMTTEKEIFQDISTSVEHTVASVVEPVLEGITDMQRMTAMREIIALERQDNVAPGTYLKYMGGGGGGENITKERVGGTIDMIKAKSKGVM